MPNELALDLGWIALRSAASLVHALPGVAARVRLDGEIVADVARPGAPDAAEGTLSPCAFRRWVGEEWAASHAGEGPSAWSAHDTRLSVEVGIPARGALLPGGVHRIPAVDRQIYVIALAAPGDLVRALATELVEQEGASCSVSRLCLRLDPLTQVTLAYCEVDPRDQGEVEPFVTELLTTLAARVGVDQLEAWAGRVASR
jgi:hypothetical protein